ncbi:SRPBCC family protein [Chryseobacterium echinoideorum]|uniref:SRPBCC family protein n=1 Tax=Chryseobacterium echinoideorum TaxID=1549648 RepID=UPI001186844E|nr:SRPBCC domain-containing protein [Chryseobacterium echinoideorum]
MENYSNTIQLKATTDKVFNALTNEIPLWWTEMFEGSANREGSSFTVRFGDNVYKTMCVEELVHNSNVVWYVEKSLIAVPGLKKQTEWIDTTIVWEITEKGNSTELHLTHIGLNPNVECYDICTNGWQQFTNSLKEFVETGKGNPYRA